MEGEERAKGSSNPSSEGCSPNNSKNHGEVRSPNRMHMPPSMWNYMINFYFRHMYEINRLEYKRTFKNSNADDATLDYSIRKCPLNDIIKVYPYMYTTPLFWTHRHEKVLHVVWQPFQSTSSPLSPHPLSTLYYGRPSKRRKWQRLRQDLLQALEAKFKTHAEWRIWWENPRRLHPGSSGPPFLLASWRPLLPSLPFSFELISESNFMIKDCIRFLRQRFPMAPATRQEDAMKVLLSAVDDWDTLGVFANLPPFRHFLRVMPIDLEIRIGRLRFDFLYRVPIYHLDTKEGSLATHKFRNWKSKLGTCWRMVHLDYTRIVKAMNHFKRYKKNFHIYGACKGMTKYEYTDRYEYEYGDGEWSHPHFIPGVFIALSQRYECKLWEFQAPVWQILLTDGPNDELYAHLYTTTVPGFLIHSFDTPGELRIPIPPSSTGEGSSAGHDIKDEQHNKHEHMDAPSDFVIYHTRIAYDPQPSFRERLRESIAFSRAAVSCGSP
ncbi:hypothetical protein SAMD00023353_0701690 [Rosellinia necatrix]|uniref:Uncharacterized protein n=1 Tax=Rosellinia necatrix TaxID=77044 RepID=A0A1S7UQ91_ROSNE|nr:hypothetical protein SAMD00023353_0701690 [Rosellinia necatrix]